MARVFNWLANRPLPGEMLSEARGILVAGGLVVYPTNTLYGLAASLVSEEGIMALNRLKARPAGMPLSVMATEAQIRELCDVTGQAEKFIGRGETRVTMVLRVCRGEPGAARDGTLGVRLPCSELTSSLVESVGPITATSANLHGGESPSTVECAIGQLGDIVPLYIDSGRLEGTPTTVVDFTGAKPKIIRQGALSQSEVMGNG